MLKRLKATNRQSAAKRAEIKMVSIENFQEKINKHYPEEHLTVLEYLGARNKCKIRCDSCGQVYSYVQSGNILSSKKTVLCHKCKDKEIQKIRFQQQLEKRFTLDNLEIISFNGNKSSCLVRCKNCGMEYIFKKPINAFKKTRDFFCKKCFPYKNNIMQEAREKFKKFISNSSQWELLQDIDSIHSNDLIDCKCLYCGRINKKTIYDYMRGRGCFCQCNTEQKTTRDFLEELDDDYELLDEYKNAYTKVTLKHKSCGFIYKVTPHNYLTGKRCPRCSRMESKGEKEVQAFLDKNNIKYIKEYPVAIDGHNLRFDFYLPEINKYIEYQGEQHYHPIDYFGGEKRFLIQCELDNKKRKYAGHNLIEIAYNENTNTILTNTLLSSTTIL